ncbi:uncharacterized protein LOC126924425 isoform X1 [Bombus affinis]|uniref:uncharacterized protein LOC126924425 isoform X1 n=1 Tax=Bombus affinis TaxID=309941 RepID=UPI0021B71AB1|nr:uncharacterized protein LOC126924425 isoform X1 [Bombus affinis]
MCIVNCLSDDTGSQTPSPCVCNNTFKYNQFLKYRGALQFPCCCTYLNCNFYWDKDWSTITATKMVIFLLLVFGFFFAILIYCRSYSRDTHQRYSAASNDNIDCRSLQSNSIYEPSVDSPPSYNAACSASPPYESPLNSVSMFEAPPVYQESSQQSKQVSHSINQPIIPNTNYI